MFPGHVPFGPFFSGKIPYQAGGGESSGCNNLQVTYGLLATSCSVALFPLELVARIEKCSDRETTALHRYAGGDGAQGLKKIIAIYYQRFGQMEKSVERNVKNSGKIFTPENQEFAWGEAVSMQKMGDAV